MQTEERATPAGFCFLTLSVAGVNTPAYGQSPLRGLVVHHTEEGRRREKIEEEKVKSVVRHPYGVRLHHTEEGRRREKIEEEKVKSVVSHPYGVRLHHTEEGIRREKIEEEKVKPVVCHHYGAATNAPRRWCRRCYSQRHEGSLWWRQW